jgi:DNA polymerase-3 subunit beta
MPLGEIQFVEEPGFVRIKYGDKIVFNISVLSDEEFPAIEIEKKLIFSKIDRKNILDLIKYTLYASSSERTRDVLRGVLVEVDDQTVRMVATDGHRLALAEKKMPAEKHIKMKSGVIVPQKGMREIVRMVEDVGEDGVVEMGFGDKSVVVKAEGEILVIRLIEGEFPNYSNVIPKKNNRIINLKRRELTESLRRVSLLVEEETKAIKFCVNKGLLVISSKRAGLGDAREEMNVECKEEVMFGLNSRYTMDVLNAMCGEEVVFEVSDEKTPIVIKEKEVEGVLAVIMPMIL